MKKQPTKRKQTKVGRRLRKPKKAASKALLASDLPRLLFDAVGSIGDYGIFLLDAHGNILTWNAGAARLKGYTAEEIVGKNFSTFYTPEDVARHHPEAELKEAKKTGRYEEEGWRVRKDGTRFWANIVITKLVDKKGALVGFSKVTRDLSARREMEQQLRESEERFRLLLAGVRDYAIYMLTPEGKVASWNEGAARIKGYTAKEVLGKHFSLFYVPEDRTAGKAEVEIRQAKEQDRYEEEGWRVRKDGSRFWANVVLTAIRDSNGKLLGFSKVTRDLTERKKAEDKLQKAYEGLEDRVRERTAELAKVNRELLEQQALLQEAIRGRDEFLSIASHELKTPITSLKMQLQMLAFKSRPREGVALEPEKIEKAVATSLRQVDRLTQLVEDLLDVVRAQAQRITFQKEATDLGQLGAEVVERLESLFEAAGCRVEMTLDEAVVGEIDRFRVDQVLVNLLTNAIKYAPGKPVRLRIFKQGNNGQIVVTDGGRGISPEDQKRLFERFERGPNAENVSGLGLGLFITRKIVEGHDGKVWVESKVGKGSSFHVTLPLEGKEGSA